MGQAARNVEETNMTQVIERRSRAEFLALTGRREFAPRPLTDDQRDKIARAVALKTRRGALIRIRLCVARVEAELSRRLDHERRAGCGGGPDYLAAEMKAIRRDLAELEC
jgi:hypothetical protein